MRDKQKLYEQFHKPINIWCEYVYTNTTNDLLSSCNWRATSKPEIPEPITTQSMVSGSGTQGADGDGVEQDDDDDDMLNHSTNDTDIG